MDHPEDSVMARQSARLLDSEPRVFPPIAADFYDSATGDADLVLSLLRRPLTSWQRLTGRGLGPLEQLGRLFQLHHEALQAELGARWTRADFFWDEVARWLRTHPAESASWKALAARVAGPTGLRRRIVGEIIIDTHIALYNGRLGAHSPLAIDDRAFAHGHHLRRLLAQESAPREQRLAILRPIADTMIEAGRMTENWASCAEACAWLTEAVSRLPAYDNQRAQFLFLETSKAAAPAQASGALNLSALRGGIEKLQRFRRERPGTDAVFQALANLYNLEAVTLGNNGDCADALVSVERALTFDPSYQTAATNRERLNEMMSQLQAHARELDVQLQSRPNVVLTVEGARLKTQATKGFGPMEEFGQSKDAAEIREERITAEARSIWVLLGFAVPEDDWTQRARALHDIVLAVLRSPPAAAEDLDGVVAGAFAKQPALSGLDHTKAMRFLSHRLFETPWTAPQAAGLPVGDAPSLSPADTQPRRRSRDSVPLDYWLFSGRGVALKLQMAVAVFLLLFAGALGTREALHRRIRSSAYERVVAGSAAQDWPAVMREAARFLSAPVLAHDQREARVSGLYAEALVRQATQQAPDEQYLDQYRRLVLHE